MALNIYNWHIFTKHFPEVSFSQTSLEEVLLKEITDFQSETKKGAYTPMGICSIESISVIFVSSKKIKQLNTDFRKKEEVTDVLSFVLQEKPIIGEIYICPEYIAEEYSHEEALRALLHGFLHIVGYQHSQKFTENSKSSEEMFVKQENMLENILYEIDNRVR